jgi:hypothetical protein
MLKTKFNQFTWSHNIGNKKKDMPNMSYFNPLREKNVLEE